MQHVDISFTDRISFYLMVGETPAGEEWMEHNLVGEVQRMPSPDDDGAVIVERRYVPDIVYGAFSDGLTVSVDDNVVSDIRPL